MAGRKAGSKNKNPRLSKVELQGLIISYESGVSTIKLGAQLGVHNATISKWLKSAGVERRPKGFQTGAGHHAWKGGRIVMDDGYVLVLIGPDDLFYPMAQIKTRTSRYVLEHRLVMARKLGRILLDSETVHHVDDSDRSNNHIDNLQLRQGRHGKGAAHCCAECGSTNIIPIPLS
jgi:hypothetical protein